MLLPLRGRGLVDPETDDEDGAFGVDFLEAVVLTVAFLSATVGFVELPDADPAAAGRVDEAFMASSSAIFLRISFKPFGNGGL